MCIYFDNQILKYASFPTLTGYVYKKYSTDMY